MHATCRPSLQLPKVPLKTPSGALQTLLENDSRRPTWLKERGVRGESSALHYLLRCSKGPRGHHREGLLFALVTSIVLQFFWYEPYVSSNIRSFPGSAC